MTLWIRLYVELVDDPKVQLLSDADFKNWINLLCIAGRNDGRLPDLASLSFMLRQDAAKLAKSLERLEKQGLIDCDGESLAPHNWRYRQFQSDGSTARVQRYRERQRNGEGNVSRNDGGAFPETGPSDQRSESDPDTESSSSSDGRGEPDDGLFGKLLEASKGNLSRAAKSVRAIGPVRTLIAEGYDLDLDILPFIRRRFPTLKQPLKNWAAAAAWFRDGIREGRDTQNLSSLPPAGSRGAPDQVFVAQGTPEWQAWAKHIGKSPPTMQHSTTRQDGWMFPSKWPPSAEYAAQRAAADGLTKGDVAS